MSIGLYTQGSMKIGVADRLMYTFAGLESLLLRDQREPLAQNIGDRLAFALEAEPSRRQELVRLVKDAYDARSRFVHHGHDIKDLTLVGRFLEAVWKFYVLPLPRALHHRTRIEFIESLDQIKYS